MISLRAESLPPISDNCSVINFASLKYFLVYKLQNPFAAFAARGFRNLSFVNNNPLSGTTQNGTIINDNNADADYDGVTAQFLHHFAPPEWLLKAMIP
jgi:hypothetical protein